MLVEGVLLEQILNRDMHAVVPEVSRVSGHIDSLGVGVGQTYLAVHSQPVLQRQDNPHSRAVHVLLDDKVGYLRCHDLRCVTPPAHLVVVELLRHLAVLFPPCAQRVGVVRAGGAYAQVRRIGGVCKRALRIFRHTLDLEAQDLQFVHYLRNAIGHHA